MDQKSIRCTAVKHLLYAALLFLLFVIQEAPALTLFGIRGIPVIGVFIAIAMLEDEFTGALYGLLAGILCDAASVPIFGLASILFLTLGCTAGLLVMYLVNGCPRSALFLTGSATLCYGLACHYFLYGFWSYEGSGMLLFTQTLPTAVLTALWGFGLYYVIRAIRDAAAARIGA